MSDGVMPVKMFRERGIERLESGNQVIDLIVAAFEESFENSRRRKALKDVKPTAKSYVDAPDAAVCGVHGPNQQQLLRHSETGRILQVDGSVPVFEQVQKLTEHLR